MTEYPGVTIIGRGPTHVTLAAGRVETLTSAADTYAQRAGATIVDTEVLENVCGSVRIACHLSACVTQELHAQIAQDLGLRDQSTLHFDIRDERLMYSQDGQSWCDMFGTSLIASGENPTSHASRMLQAVRRTRPEAVLKTSTIPFPPGMHSDPNLCVFAQEDPKGYRPRRVRP